MNLMYCKVITNVFGVLSIDISRYLRTLLTEELQYMGIKRKQCTETHDIQKENIEKNLWTNQRTKWPMENQNQ